MSQEDPLSMSSVHEFLESLSLQCPPTSETTSYPPRMPVVMADYVPPTPAVDLFKRDSYLRVAAPMVRYSKLPFRMLVRKYGCDLVYTPMILANVFKNAMIARDCEFRTCVEERPVVIQFAASNARDFAEAAELVAPYVNGIDLNCGCPQKWAYHEQIGSFLMESPETVRDCVRAVKARCSPLFPNGIPCSIKIRVHKDLRETVEFARQMEAAGADFITVHGRTRRQKSTEPVNFEGIKLVKENVAIPVVANGNVFSKTDADNIVAETGVNGVMAARGLLRNPALFSHDETPYECVVDFVSLALERGMNFFIFHHHLMFMMETIMSKQEKKSFNCLMSVSAVVDWLEEHYGMDFRTVAVVK